MGDVPKRRASRRRVPELYSGLDHICAEVLQSKVGDVDPEERAEWVRGKPVGNLRFRRVREPIREGLV